MLERKTIRQLRQERGWTQAELAERLGVSRDSISAWERGLTSPRFRTVLRLAQLFRVSITDIAFGPAGQEPQERP